MSFALLFTIIHKLTKEKKVLLKANAFMEALPILNNTDAILFYYHPQVTYMPQRFHDLPQTLHIIFILFVSMCTTYNPWKN